MPWLTTAQLTTLALPKPTFWAITRAEADRTRLYNLFNTGATNAAFGTLRYYNGGDISNSDNSGTGLAQVDLPFIFIISGVSISLDALKRARTTGVTVAFAVTEHAAVNSSALPQAGKTAWLAGPLAANMVATVVDTVEEEEDESDGQNIAEVPETVAPIQGQPANEAQPPGMIESLPVAADGDETVADASTLGLSVVLLQNGGANNNPLYGITSIGGANFAALPLAGAAAVRALAAAAGGSSIVRFVPQTLWRNSVVYRLPKASWVSSFVDLLPGPVKIVLAALTGYATAEIIDAAIDIPGWPDSGFGPLAVTGQTSTWSPSVGDNVGIGQGGAYVTKTWVANDTPFVALSDGRLGARKKTGMWRFWRPRKPVGVIYSDGATDLKSFLAASKALRKQAREAKKIADSMFPARKTREPRNPEQGRRVVEGNVIRNTDVR